MMVIELPANVSSVADLRALTLEIRSYAKWHTQTAIKQHLELSQSNQPPVLSADAKGLVQSSISDPKTGLSRQDLDGLIETLDVMHQDLPRLTITLAAPATNQVKRTLVAWCRQNIQANVMVSFTFNSTLLGGMVVRYGSRIFDWSFRRQILDHSHKFPHYLRDAGTQSHV